MKLKVFGVILVITSHISCALSSPLSETYVLHTRANTEQDDDSYRLPKSVKPVNYAIKLTPNLKLEESSSPWTYDGKVDITVSVEENTDNITLHSNDIDIKTLKVTLIETETPSKYSHPNDIDIKTLKVTLRDTEIPSKYNLSNDERQFLIIRKDDNTDFKPKQTLLISIEYTGYLRDDMRGFYRSYYHQNGTKRWLATTQFEPTHARRAFPCFDEPSFKATFEIVISVEEGFTAISNMLLKKKDDLSSPGRVLFEFEKTQPMSTYLIAFMVFDFVPSKQSKEWNLKIWSRADAINDTKFSVEESPKILKALETFLNTEYTLTKMDEVAVPDFSAGAMENWGLVTYRERLLLSNDELTDSLSKQRIFTTIAHEFAHQWFGDLVSPEWWSYTWLNEGFATYFEYFITHELKQTWRLDEQFVVRGVQTAFGADASESTHAMTHSVGSPEAVWGLFDTISYQKAGAVIRMLEHFLSHEVFRSGLEGYLKSSSLTSAEPEDLFIALNKSYNAENPTNTEVDPMEVMEQWSTQPGYPVVTVNGMENGSVQLQQERFFLKKTNMTAVEDSPWIIPISYACVDDKASFNNTAPRIFMRESEQYISEFNTSRLCLINVKQSGYYRVNYDTNMWNEIIRLLLQEKFADLFPALTRAQLLDDSFALAQAGIISYEIPMSLSKYLENEKDFIPWYSALNSLSFLNTRFHGTKKYALFNEYTLNLLKNIYNEVGFKEITKDDHVKKLLQNLVLTWTCKLKHKECVGNSTEMFRNMKNETRAVPIPADLQSVVYCTAVREGDASDFQFLWDRYNSSNVATERTLILSALGCANNQELINGLLLTAITDPNTIRMQDVESVFSAVYSSPGGVDLALEFVAKHYKEIESYFKKFNGDIASLILGIASRITNTDQFEKLKKIHEGIGGNAIFTAAEKIVQENLEWMEKNQLALLQMITPSGAGSISTAFYLIILLSISYLYVHLQ